MQSMASLQATQTAMVTGVFHVASRGLAHGAFGSSGNGCMSRQLCCRGESQPSWGYKVLKNRIKSVFWHNFLFQTHA